VHLAIVDGVHPENAGSVKHAKADATHIAYAGESADALHAVLKKPMTSAPTINT
jgi:hypothetical protein